MKYSFFTLLFLLVIHTHRQEKPPIIDMHLHAHEVESNLQDENRLTGDMALESTEKLRKDVWPHWKEIMWSSSYKGFPC